MITFLKLIIIGGVLLSNIAGIRIIGIRKKFKAARVSMFKLFEDLAVNPRLAHEENFSIESQEKAIRACEKLLSVYYISYGLGFAAAIILSIVN